LGRKENKRRIVQELARGPGNRKVGGRVGKIIAAARRNEGWGVVERTPPIIA